MSNLATIVNNILADSGIDDINVVVTTGSYNNPAWITGLSWSKISSTPTTLSGYGITDAVPAIRTITINGTAQDLSANRSWSVGTVTSVDMTVPTGFAISGRPITSSGTLALTFAAGYSLPSNSTQGVWNIAYSRSLTAASVTGTTTKTLTLTQQDGSTLTASWTDYDTAPVTSVNAGTGISVNSTTGAVTVTNTGVLSINGSTGAVTGIITTSNYNLYSPTLTGGGASGTWGINITGSATQFNGLNFNGVTSRFQADLNTLGLASTSGIYNIGAGYTNGPAGDLYGTLFGIWNSDISVQFWATYNGDFYWRKSVGSTYAGSTWRTILDSSNFGSYAVPIRGVTNWNDGTVLNYVIGMLGWKNYGGNHVIFDASASTSPSGVSISNTNAQNAWTGTYPTLMGWNGSQTYGVRVDSARVSDNTSGNSATTSQTNFTALTINSAAVATQSWVNSQGFVTGGPYLALSGGTVTGPVYMTGGSSTTPNLTVDRNIAAPANYYTGLQLEVRATSGTAGIALHRNGFSHVGIYHDSSNELKFNMNAGTPVLGAGVGTIIGSGNYNSYAPTLTGGGASGTWGINVTGSSGSTGTLLLTGLGNGTVNVNNPNTAVYRNENGLGAAVAYAPLLHLGGGDTMWQIQGTYGSSGSGVLYFRQGYNGSWGTWLTMLSSSNYNNYSPTLTGGGASGTWSINITGSSASANELNATSVSNLNTDRPPGKLQYYDQPGGTGAPGGGWHSYISLRHGNSVNQYGFQLANGFGSNDLLFRGWDGANPYSWVTILTTNNYNSYSPTLTGGGASGTWSINVTGTAASETLSTVTGRGNSTGSTIYIDQAGQGFTFRTSTSWGGWARNTHVITDSANTTLAAFGGYGGGGSSLSYSFIGIDYNNTWIRFSSSAVNSQVALQQDGNQVLHAGNYNSYAPTLTGGGASGTWGINITGNSATVSSITNITGLMTNRLTPTAFIDGLTTTNFRSTVFGTSANGAALSAARWNNVPSALSGMNLYGTMIAWSGDSDTQGFIATDYITANAQIGGGYGNIISWRATLLHSSNYNSYSPTLTGGGASGTWGISITGSASSASSASSAGTVVGRQRGTFVVGGNTSTFYPVAFQIGSSATSEQGISVLQIERGGYDEPGYSSTGFGTFHCRIRAKADGWGYGASYVQLEQNAYTIPMLAEFTQQNQTSQLIVWLRGGQAYRWLDVEGGWTLNFDNAAGGNYVTFSGNVTYTPTTTNSVSSLGKWFKGWSETKCDGFIESESDVRAPIFYDSKNTSFYADLNSLSNIQRLQTQQNWYDNSSSDWGGGINLKGTACTVGWQPSNQTWWYMMHTSSENMNFYRRASNGGSWNQDGVWYANGTFNWRERVNLGPETATPYLTEFLSGLTFGGNEANEGAYRIYTKLENINGNYTKLIIGWHTGLKIGASSSYGGTRFYNNAPYAGSKVFSIAEGDNHTRAYNNMYAAAFFETSDKRLKELVEDDYSVSGIELIKPKLYKKNGVTEVGYYAQDFEEILPTAIAKELNGYLNLSYTQVHTMKIAYLEDSIEEIKAKILYLEQQLKNKTNENN